MGGETVLRSIDLDITAGRVVVLRGSNGAGKTTLLKVLATRLRPTSGGGAVHGDDLITRAAAVRAHVGFLGVYGGNYPMLSARENLELASALTASAASDKGKVGVPAAAGIAAALELGGLGHTRNKLVRTFSSGMKKRLGLARLVLTDPRLWLLDEPYAALDDEAKSLVDRLVAEARGRGRTVLMASHESDRTELAPDAVLLLDAGLITDTARAGGVLRRSVGAAAGTART